MKTATLTLSDEEANALLKLIDLSVRANGLQFAETAVVLTKKIQAVFTAEEKEPHV